MRLLELSRPWSSIAAYISTKSKVFEDFSAMIATHPLVKAIDSFDKLYAIFASAETEDQRSTYFFLFFDMLQGLVKTPEEFKKLYDLETGYHSDVYHFRLIKHPGLRWVGRAVAETQENSLSQKFSYFANDRSSYAGSDPSDRYLRNGGFLMGF